MPSKKQSIIEKTAEETGWIVYPGPVWVGNFCSEGFHVAQRPSPGVEATLDRAIKAGYVQISGTKNVALAWMRHNPTPNSPAAEKARKSEDPADICIFNVTNAGKRRELIIAAPNAEVAKDIAISLKFARKRENLQADDITIAFIAGHASQPESRQSIDAIIAARMPGQLVMHGSVNSVRTWSLFRQSEV